MIKIGIYHLAPEQIVAVLPGDNGHTQINTTSEVFFVTESPEYVTRKILEYKMLMVKMNAYYSGSAITAFKEFEEGCLITVDLVKISLNNLAGLEE